MEELVLEVTNGITQICQCEFLSGFIVDTKFLCDKNDPENVIVQGQIITTNDRDSAFLVEDLEQWASGEPVVRIQGEQLQVVSSGVPTTNTDEGEDAPWIAVGVSVAIFTLLVVAVVSVIIACVIYVRSPTRYCICVTIVHSFPRIV